MGATTAIAAERPIHQRESFGEKPLGFAHFG
jgi:hypothetical protein